jgi:tetratricopeptide (TPR) repeat protein
VSRNGKARKLEAAATVQQAERLRRQDAEPLRAQHWVHWLTPLLVASLTLTAFLPTLHNQFVNWDDDYNFVDNPHYRGLAWPHLRWMWTTFHMGHYIPLTWMTLGWDHLLWGMNPVGYHLTSLLLHATNALIFYFLALRLLTVTRPSPADHDHALALSAGFAALVFALHPLRVESVAWATERRDVLSGLFFLMTILVYLRACDQQERGRGWYWGAVGLFGCALLSKSMAVSLPVVLLILDGYPLRRLGGATGWWSAPARRVYAGKIPFVLLAAAASAVAFRAQISLHAMASLTRLTMLGRLAVSAYGLSFYLWKMVVPLNLSPLYMLPLTVNPWAPPFILSYGLVLTITGSALAFRRRWPGLPAAWLAYVMILLPVLGIFQNGPQITADRYSYLAGLGWAILAGAALFSCWRAWGRSQTAIPATVPLAGIAVPVCVVVGLGVLTWNQVQVWHDSERLWSYTLAIDPNSSFAQNNFGFVLHRQGKPTEAIKHFQQALHIKPDLAEAHTNWGAALLQQGQPLEAIGHFQQALRIQPDSAGAHTNWGTALLQQGQPLEAIDHFRQALRIKPEYADAHTNWGAALVQRGQPLEAIDHVQQALRIKPDSAEAHTNWGAALLQQGQSAEAIDHYRQALQIKPDYAAAHVNWGNTLAQLGKPADAAEHYQRALRIKPDYVEALNNLGVVLTRQGKPAEAIDHYRRALQIKPDYADAHFNWGNTLAQQGKPAEAVEHYQRALHIKSDYAEALNNLGVVLTRQGKPAEAIAHFRQALHIKPDYADALDSWGQALARQGKLTEAIDYYRQALRIKPDYAEAHNNWGLALAKQGKLPDAIEHYRQALRIEPDLAAAHTNWGQALAQQGRQAEAIQHYREAAGRNGQKVE